MVDSLGNKTKSSVYWLATRMFAIYGIRIFTSIILARILDPVHFGLISMAMVAVSFARRIGEFGFAMVLIQNKNITEEHKKTAFTLGLIIGLILNLSLVSISGVIADIFNDPRVKSILMVVSLNFVLSAIFVIPAALMKREMNYKAISNILLWSNIISLITPVIFAILGFGVWSLVLGMLLGNFYNIIAYFIVSPWRPKIGISKYHLKEMLPFGFWVNMHQYVNFLINNVDFFFVGRYLGAEHLGYYERAFNFMDFARRRLRDLLNNVLFSAYSKIQDDEKRLLEACDKVVLILSLVAYPFLTWLFFSSPALITLLYGEKWIPTILPLQIMTISGLLNTLTQIFYPLMMSKALVKEKTIWYFYYFIILAISVYVGMRWDIVGVAVGVAVASFANIILNVELARRKMNYTLGRFFKKQFVAIQYTMFMIIFVLGAQFFLTKYFARTSLEMLIALFILCPIGYLIPHKLFRKEEVNEIFLYLLGDKIELLRSNRYGKYVIKFLHV